MNWRQVIIEVLTREGAACEMPLERVERVVARVLLLLRERFRCIKARPPITERRWPIGYHPVGVERALLPREKLAWRQLETEMADWPRRLQIAVLRLVGYYVCADRPFDP
jgi:hypothetical protein